ncbi:TetR/AcrR family transcriptional regulator [Sorangium cellulosum]|uniref:TetR/AcrR family transcriptional regulator n=1 Tax=Sorangium cellulosum TaxID=56 RepID=UPI001F3E99A6|nr:TetR/AcrR family transcriptional regulator [Sorangium cellulosum]
MKAASPRQGAEAGQRVEGAQRTEAGHSAEGGRGAGGRPRRMGRPRKAPQPSDLAPREQILAAAGRLFAERGVVEVSMLEIAQAAGLRQSSLYYWFRGKEPIVAEILQQVNRLPLVYVRRLEASGGAADVQLWRFVRFDVRTVCGFPLEITEIHRFSERAPDAFATYWSERRALTEAVAAIVGRGVGEGTFREVDAYLCALTVLAQDESVQNWYRPGGAGRVHPLAASDPAALGYRPEQIAELVADQTVGGLLARPARLAALRRKALAADGEG